MDVKSTSPSNPPAEWVSTTEKSDGGEGKQRFKNKGTLEPRGASTWGGNQEKGKQGLYQFAGLCNVGSQEGGPKAEEKTEGSLFLREKESEKKHNHESLVAGVRGSSKK